MRGGEVVGEGFHRRAGEPHAEVLALAAAGERARGATLYVNLEPCSHHGRTPPCAEAVVAAGVARVVACHRDPDRRVSGRGFETLRRAGIAVEVGERAAEAVELNCRFLVNRILARPAVTLKWAMSLDGKIATAAGESQWISGPAARRWAISLRNEHDAILVGIGTVLADDPQLTVRFDDETAFAPPLRVVLDSHLRIPAGRRVMDGAAPSLVCCEPEAVSRNRHVPPGQLMSVPHHATGLGLAIVMAELAQRGINEVQVEAGPTLSGALLHAGLVDELLLYVDTSVIGDTGLPLLNLPPLASLDTRVRFATVDRREVGDTLRLLLRPKVAA